MTKPNEYDASGAFSRADVQNQLVLTAAEERIVGLERLLSERIAALRLRFEERIQADDAKLKLQAQEYERRLEALNNENARILKAQESSVSADKFDGYREKTDQSLARIQLEQTNYGGRNAGSKATLAAIVAAIALLLQVLGFAFAILHK